jgi:glucan phosphoethanolaminetransferase (alkaline phosphatase superfamily)
MNTQTFSIKEMLSASWHLFKANKRFIISAAAVTIVVNFLLQIIQSNSGTLGALFTLFITILITIGWAKIFLGIVSNESVSWNTFKSEPVVWLRFIKTYVWYILYIIGYSVVVLIIPTIITIIGLATGIDAMVVVGVILGSTAFVFVNIYFGVRYQFLRFAVLEYSDLRSRDIFKKAGALTDGNFWKLFLFGMVLGLVNILGFICLVVGLFATIPTTKLAQTKVYHYLKSKHSA